MGKRRKKRRINKEPSVIADDKQPETSEEMINFYGTYNVQRTSCSDNEYPDIAQQ